MLRGLIRVLTEDSGDCCDGVVGTLFTDAIAKNIAKWEDVIIYTSRSDKNDEINGVDAETYYEGLTSLPEKCKFLNTILNIKDNGALEIDAKNRIDEIHIDICPSEAPEESEGQTATCTDPLADKVAKANIPNFTGWYRFAYGGRGKKSHQARMDYYYLILDKLGIGMFAPGEEGKCIEKMRIWEHEPEEHQTHPEVTQYHAPKIDWWKGFKINCACIPEDSPYKNVSLNIFDLDHPNIKGYKTGIPIDKSSSGNITPTNNPVKVDNSSDDNDGLVNVLDDEITNPYEDIRFL